MFRLSPQAERDLEEIGDYIAREKPRAAQRMVQAIRHKCREIGEHPHFYPLREGVAPGFRQALVKPYGIWYRVLEDGNARIERIVHGARDISSLLGE
jgi:toxin ParE1/3/4